MSLHLVVFLLVVCLIISLTLLWRFCWPHRRPCASRGRAKPSMLPLCWLHLISSEKNTSFPLQ
jgi:hypothetical protein